MLNDEYLEGDVKAKLLFNGSWNLNNEALAFYAMVNVLKHSKSINIANALLIAPVLLHQPSCDIMAKSSLKIRGVEELFIRFPMPFVDFNKRFYSLMPISFNAINMLLEFKLVFIKENNIVALNDLRALNIQNPNKNNSRLNSIVKGSNRLAEFLDEDPKTFYSALAIKL
jgi:hypothetical protein